MSLAVSVENVSKVYRLGETDRRQFLGDFRRWAKNKFSFTRTFGDPEVEAEQEPSASDLFYALKNVSFEIKRGDTVGIIGANGAGKSTLLKLISRITLPSTGSIKINGRIGSLLEVGTGFNQDLSGRDNVYMNGAILGMSRKEVASKFDDIVSFAGVEKFIDTPVKRYSSGMYVRLAFSVAAFLQSEIMIVDEVLAVGDQQFQNQCIGRLQDLIKEGRTLLFVSHGPGLIRRLCSRAICLKSGEVLCDDEANKALEVYHNSVKRSLLDSEASAAKEAEDEGLANKRRDARRLAKAALLECTPKDESGKDIKSCLTSAPFSIEFTYVLRVEDAVRPVCIVCDELGNILFQTGDYSRDLHKVKVAPGVYTSTMHIPRHLLAPGGHQFHIGLASQTTGQQLFYMSDAAAINIIDDLGDWDVRGGYKGILPGFFRPVIKWKTEKSEDQQTGA